MTDYAYDPDFPFVVVYTTTDTNETRAYARYATWFNADDEARDFTEARVIDTTPIRFPAEFGTIVQVPGFMPLLRIGPDRWVMPQPGGAEEVGGVGIIKLAAPIGYAKYQFTDDEVGKFVTGRAYEVHAPITTNN